MKNSLAFGKGIKAKTLWKCAVAALFWGIVAVNIYIFFLNFEEIDVDSLKNCGMESIF